MIAVKGLTARGLPTTAGIETPFSPQGNPAQNYPSTYHNACVQYIHTSLVPFWLLRPTLSVSGCSYIGARFLT